MTEPDPVRDAEAYRASLLAALGDDDPADAQATTGASIRALLAEAGADLRTRPAPGEWSVLECIGHMTDGELVSAARYRWIVAEEVPDIVGYDQAIWVDRLDHRAGDPEMLVATFEALRTANLALWARTSTEQHARYGIHRERGQESFDLMFRLIGGHDRVHLAQARRALAAVR